MGSAWVPDVTGAVVGAAGWADRRAPPGLTGRAVGRLKRL